MDNFTLQRSSTGLLVIDVQEKLFDVVERSCEVMPVMLKVAKGFNLLEIPILASEQYPQGLGPTVASLKIALGPTQQYFSKTTFSCLGTTTFRAHLLKMPVTQWVLMGIEAHVCVLQTAKDLLREGKQVAVLNDAISSRSIYDFSTAIAEMRDLGVRVTSAETVLFELLQDSKTPEFKSISKLIK